MNRRSDETRRRLTLRPERRNEFRVNLSAALRRSLLQTSAAVVIAVALAPALPVKAAGPDPVGFINNVGNQLQMVTSSISPDQRLAGFRQLFQEDFDVTGLGRFVLGRFWRILTTSEQQEFLGLFENYVVAAYSDRLSEYTSRKSLRVIGSRPDADGMIVSSEIVGGSETGPMGRLIKVDWRLTGHDGVYKISDVIINGLSMAVTGRSQMQGVAERNGGQPQAILAVMRQESANAALR